MSSPATPTLQEYYDSLQYQLELVKDLAKECVKYDCYPDDLPGEYLSMDHKFSDLISNLERESRSISHKLKSIKKIIDLAAFK